MSQDHTVIATSYHRTFSRTHPVLERIEPGDTVVTKTVDSGGQDENSEHQSESGNPLTGPYGAQNRALCPGHSERIFPRMAHNPWSVFRVRGGGFAGCIPLESDRPDSRDYIL